MAASRSNPPGRVFQIQAIPDSLTDTLQDWGNKQQLAEILKSIDGNDHLQELKAKVCNLTITSLQHKDLQDSTRTAVLAAILPLIILALLAAGSLAVCKA